MFRAKPIAALSERRVLYLLAVFFAALALPSFILIRQAYSQLKWESFRQAQTLAGDLAARIDSSLSAAVRTEDGRSFADYGFLVVEGDPAAGFVQRSVLSAFPVESAIPGALGYFQVDAAGLLTTPLLPPSNVDPRDYGIPADQLAARRALEQTIRRLLAQNRLLPRAQEDAAAKAVAPGGKPESAELAAVATAPAQARDTDAARGGSQPEAGASAGAALLREQTPAAPPQAAFDQLASGSAQAVPEKTAGRLLQRLDDLKLSVPFEEKQARAPSPAPRDKEEAALRRTRTEQNAVPEARPPAASFGQAGRSDSGGPLRVSTFQSEVDPLEFGLLDTGHVVMFRKVWRDGQRYIQGALIDRQRFIQRAVDGAFRASSLSATTDLIVAYGGKVLSTLAAKDPGPDSSAELAGSLLYRARMSPPLGGLELIFSLKQLPRGPGSLLLGWLSVTLAAVLCGGFYLMYRFAVGQIRLARQQQDFVSAVSHELRTPLTSIRMYGEMLKAGWADERKKQTYYEYIYGESERLSRLIENVLQLARMSRNAPQLDLKQVSVAELMDIVRSKTASQVERAGFQLDLRSDPKADAAELFVDPDCFTQIMINLVDNAIKFSATATCKRIELSCGAASDGDVSFKVRDFGPGIPKSQLKKIFGLFYRPDNELTRETVGTGIGLALVRQLTTAMGGRVDVRACEPGAEFTVTFPQKRVPT